MSKVIGEHMLTITDAFGHITMVLQATLNHRKDKTACELKDRRVYVNNQKKLIKSTQG